MYGVLLYVLQSYQLVIKKRNSIEYAIHAGVPQGSILGPLMRNIPQDRVGIIFETHQEHR